MKAGIHPELNVCKVTCTCGNEFEILSEKESLQVDLCSACHPFFTGQQKFVDSAGRVDKFAQRYAMTSDKLKDLTKKKEPKKKKTKLQHKINPKAKKPTLSADDDKKGKKGDDAKAEKKDGDKKDSK